ncbi:MAG: hypothetical protein ACYC99_09135 [Candidatus Geothermincolia bacterium]
MQNTEQPSGPPVPPVAPTQPRAGQPWSAWNAPAIVGLVSTLVAAFSMIVVLILMASTASHTSLTVIANLVRIVIFALLILMPVAVLVVAILAATRYNTRAAVAVQPWTYDMAVFKRYQDCLAAVSIGAGREAPPLVVTNMPAPLAYIDYQSPDVRRTLFSTAMSPPMGVARVIAVTNSLLATDFTYQEIEAVAAAMLARTIVDVGDQPPPGYYDRCVKELELNDYMVGITRAEFYDDRVCLFPMLSDAFAARLTGQPEAITSAIKKSDVLLQSNRLRPRSVEPRMMFVEPSTQGEGRFSNLGALFVNAPYRSTGDKRDRIIQLRLENLDIIKQGMRNPHQEIRDGVPVTGPEGWE